MSHLRHDPREIEKDQVGWLWAERSQGRCLFLTAFKNDGRGGDVSAQIDHVAGAA
jgi:hypothetical protein